MRHALFVAALWWFAVCPPASAQVKAEGAPPGAAPSPGVPGPDDEVRAFLERGVAEYAGGRWDEARALFEQAHRLKPTARTARGIGMAAFNQRDYVAAVTFLSLALSSTEQPLTDAQRTQVADLRAKALAFVGRFRFDVTKPEARIEVRGAPTVPGAEVILPLGTHLVRAAAPGFLPTERQLEVRGGEEQRVTLTLAPAPPGGVVAPRRRFDSRPLEWSLLGGAGAAAVAGLGVLVRSNVKYDALEKRCKKTRCFSDDPETNIERLDHTATALWITSGALAVGAGVFITTRLLRERKSEREPVQVGFTGRGVVVSGRY